MKVQLNLAVPSELRRTIEKAAKKSGRSVSAEGTHWLESYLQYQEILRGRSAREISFQDLQRRAHSLGYTLRSGPGENDQAFLSPGHPYGAQPFVPIRPGDPETVLEGVAVPPSEPEPAHIGAERIRALEERIAKLEAMQGV